VTVPLLAPVLSVVFITMINVLRVFDIVSAVAPEFGPVERERAGARAVANRV
jgi:ABC-type sugar transport system permease subunit